MPLKKTLFKPKVNSLGFFLFVIKEKMNICVLIQELENIRDSNGKDVEVAVQDRINVNGADPCLKLAYSNKEFVSRTSGNYFVDKVFLL